MARLRDDDRRHIYRSRLDPARKTVGGAQVAGQIDELAGREWLVRESKRDGPVAEAREGSPGGDVLRSAGTIICRGQCYLSRLRRDSVGADFQSVRKLTNYICAKPPESRLRLFSNAY
jgi:hypothetical protein